MNTMTFRDHHNRLETLRFEKVSVHVVGFLWSGICMVTWFVLDADTVRIQLGPKSNSETVDLLNERRYTMTRGKVLLLLIGIVVVIIAIAITHFYSPMLIVLIVIIIIGLITQRGKEKNQISGGTS
jgi:hypothetical protein